MKRFILAPDSFKGTLTAKQVCEIEAEVIRRHIPDAQIRRIPMADGGEGMVDAYLNLNGGTRVTVPVTGPLGDVVQADYGILPDGSAVIEMAAAAGLPLVYGRENPMITSTFGVGELVLHAAAQGVKKVMLGLGGSCTNDCGIGMASALGFRFLDGSGQNVVPLACNLSNIEQILPPDQLPQLELLVSCDVTNPLLGETGATYTFGPQKGADAAMLAQLEAGMAHFAAVLENYCGKTVASVPGAGAAGGMGAMVLGLLGGTLLPGTQLLLESVHFDQLLKQADLVITGEGRTDWQSAHGKVPGVVAAHCKAAQVPCILLCGAMGPGAEALYECGATAMFSAVNRCAPFEEIRRTAAQDLEALTDSVVRMLTMGS